METIYFLGIDVSKKKFDGALTIDGKNCHQVESRNSGSEIKAFFTTLKKKFALPYSNLIVCMEHTGVYCRPLLEFLIENQIRVCVESSTQIKRSQGLVRGKSDKIDAQRIALYAYKNRENLNFWAPQRLIIQKLKALLVTRERLVKVKTELEVPIAECEEFIEASVHKMIVNACQNSLKVIEGDIAKTEKMIDDLIKEDTQLHKQYELATSVTGIGKITGFEYNHLYR